MSVAMVDRLFWRAGFGPTQAQRDAWVGKRQVDLVDWFLNTPLTFAPTDTPPKTGTGVTPIDPRVSDDELVMEWVDRMQRAEQPAAGPAGVLLAPPLGDQPRRRHGLLRLGGQVPRPAAQVLGLRSSTRRSSFRRLAYEITTADAAMSAYLNLNANTKTKPNENYARELMELFCLGPTAPDGTPNYTQTDIEGLTRALTGWRLEARRSTLARRRHARTRTTARSRSRPGQFYMPVKTFLGGTIPAVTGRHEPGRPPTNLAWGPASVNQAIDIVLAHPQHAQFLIRKLWAEFIASPIPQATLDALISLQGEQLPAAAR